MIGCDTYKLVSTFLSSTKAGQLTKTTADLDGTKSSIRVKYLVTS